jgi:hypothetical protein
MGVLVTSRGARLRRVLAGSVLSATMGVALVAGPVATSSASASMSPFCKTLTTFHPKSPPSASNYTAYRTWAKQYLPFFQKLAAEAPNAATKTLMNDMVQYIKADINTTSAKALSAYMYAHRVQWAKGWKAFLTATMACVTSLY